MTILQNPAATDRLQPFDGAATPEAGPNPPPIDDMPPPTALDGMEPMPPVPEAEIEAAFDFHRGGVVRGIKSAWRRIFPERPFDPERREFVRKAAIVGAVGAIATMPGQAYALRKLREHDDAALESNWPEDKPSFTFIGETKKDPEELAIFFPGFGDQASAEEAAVVKATGELDAEIPFGYLEYSNEGTTIDQLVEAIREKVPNLDKLKSLTLVCRSLGGPLALGVAYRLGIPVKNILFFSSPYTPPDGDFGNYGADVAKLPEDIEGSAAAEYMVNYWRNVSRERNYSPFPHFVRAATGLLNDNGYKEGDSIAGTFDQVMQGLDDMAFNSALSWNQVMSGANPIALQQELRTWDSELLPTRRSDLTPKQLARYRKVFDPKFTKVLYTATDHPTTDGTVKVISSAYHYKRFFVNILGLPEESVRVQHIPYDGHANVSASVKDWAVQNWLGYNTHEEIAVANPLSN